MLVKYSMGFRTPSVILLAGFLLLIPQSFCAHTTCPPPDFPEGGKYEPEKAEYLEGMIIKYTCNLDVVIFEKDFMTANYTIVTCQSNGKWSEGTPFCDTPAKIQLKNPTTSITAYMKALTITDGNVTTCFPIPKGTEEFMEFSLERKMVVYATLVCWWHGSTRITINISESLHAIYDYTFYRTIGCRFGSHQTNDEKTEYLTVQVSPEKKRIISLCEISIYAKEDDWCRVPPENSVANGQLEVSRKKAVLHCNEGFMEKDGRRVYATCKNNTWSYLNLQCVETSCDLAVGNLSFSEGGWKSDGKTSDFFGTTRTLKCEPGYHSEGEPITVTCIENGTWTRISATCKKDKSQKDYKVLAIVVGLVIVIVILILVGSTIFLIRRKRLIGLSVIFKPGRNNRHSSSPFIDESSTTSIFEAENSALCFMEQSETTW